ncbi:phage tail protein [Paucibacter sp. APW11]|uniref:Phage tail protein n=1 Tax=Roseateles aquae TaxID=3077235 RepID=A0ABU3P6K4_9BURK|nr:phage tail protein [Paucibacter sp. APW11]MDT8998200.1 phage tail protein [Paucibacter sp. APW11]
MSAYDLLSAKALGLWEAPPVAFHFSVNIGLVPAGIDSSFQEVSGLTQSLETDELREVSESGYRLPLPRGVKQGTLSLKRGIAPISSPLMQWCMATLQVGLALRIQPLPILVKLLDPDGLPLRAWLLGDAYPISWEFDSFASTKNDMAIEQIDLQYTSCVRML